MINKKFVLPILCSALLLGLSACGNENGEYDAALCGNQQLDEGENCDILEGGVPSFAQGARVCPEGHEVADLNLITCTSQCAVDTSACTQIQGCGNNKISGTEVCDGTDLGGKTCETQLGTGATGSLACAADCSALDTSACTAAPGCNNGALDEGELCDKRADGAFDFDVSKRVCPEGYEVTDVNLITCTSECALDTSACTEIQSCGNNKVTGTEICDGTDLGGKTCETQLGPGATGSLACAGDCLSFDTTACERCTDGEKKCSEGKLSTCEGGLWIHGADAICASGHVCLDGATACTQVGGYCEHGKCESNVQYACVDNVFDEGTVCSAGYECKAGYYVCQKKSNYCDADECSGITLGVRKCVNHELQEAVACQEGYECNPVYGHKQCEKSFDYCETDKCDSETEKWKKCEKHLFSPWQACPDTSCKDAISCGECKNGTKTCISDVYKTCSTGTWSAGEDCAAKGMICDLSQGCVYASACGNTAKDPDEICDASAVSDPLSGEGVACDTYDSTKYTANGGKLKCSATCTIDDSACARKNYIKMGLCRFESIDLGTVKLRFTPETGLNAGKYQFRLLCGEKIESNADWMTDIKIAFPIIDVPANNNGIYEKVYNLEEEFIKTGTGNFDNFSSKGDGLHYCILQYRKGTSLSSSWSNGIGDVCSAQAGKTGSYSFTEADTLTLNVPKRTDLALWDFEAGFTPSLGSLTTGALIERTPAGDIALVASQGVSNSQAAGASGWSLSTDANAALNSAPYFSIRFSTKNKRGINLLFMHKGSHNMNTTPSNSNSVIVALLRGASWQNVAEFTNYNATYPTKAQLVPFNGEISNRDNVELRLIPYDMKDNSTKLFLDNVVIRAWE